MSNKLPYCFTRGVLLQALRDNAASSIVAGYIKEHNVRLYCPSIYCDECKYENSINKCPPSSS